MEGLFADGLLGVRRNWWLLQCSHLLVPLCIVVCPLHCCVSCWGSSHCRVWGGLVPSCFAARVLFFLLVAHSPLLVCVAGGGGGCLSLPPVAAVGWSDCDLGGTKGTGHFCTCLQIYKLTYHWLLLGLFYGECDALLLLCILGC